MTEIEAKRAKDLGVELFEALMTFSDDPDDEPWQVEYLYYVVKGRFRMAANKYFSDHETGYFNYGVGTLYDEVAMELGEPVSVKDFMVILVTMQSRLTPRRTDIDVD